MCLYGIPSDLLAAEVFPIFIGIFLMNIFLHDLSSYDPFKLGTLFSVINNPNVVNVSAIF